MPHEVSGLVRQIASLAAWLILLTLIFVPLEALAGLRPRRVWRKTIGADLFFYFFNTLFLTVVMAVPLAVLAAVSMRLLPDEYLAGVAGLPIGVRIVLGLIVSEFGAYWAHRATHENAFLWRFHSVHHSAEHLDYMVNTRAHPVDLVFVRLAAIVPLFVTGLAQAGSGGSRVSTIVLLVGTAWTFFVHANVRLRFGPLEWLLSTPAFHHWHHTNCDKRDHNYAAILPFMDRLFGTHHLPRQWPAVYGVDAPVEQTVTGQLLLRPASAQGLPGAAQPR